VTPDKRGDVLVGVTRGGRLVWEPTSGPAVVVAVTPAGYQVRSRFNRLEALTPDHRVLWRHSMPGCGDPRAIAVDATSTAFVVCDNRVTVIDAHGRERWTYTLTGTDNVDGISLAPGGGAYVYGQPLNCNDASILVALTSTGAVRWRGTIDQLAGIPSRGACDAGLTISAAAVAANGTVYIGTTDHLAALSSSGRRLWQRSITPSEATIANEIDAIVIGRHGIVYVGGSNTIGGPAFIEAFDPSGHPLRTWTTGNGISSTTLHAMVLGADGTIYAQARGKIYHFHSE
jgi:outer membrane protein assembly factor BamB